MFVCIRDLFFLLGLVSAIFHIVIRLRGPFEVLNIIRSQIVPIGPVLYSISTAKSGPREAVLDGILFRSRPSNRIIWYYNRYYR